MRESRHSEPCRTGAFREWGRPPQAAYRVLKKALSAEPPGGEWDGASAIPTLKRKMLELDPAFDEGELGFGKFSRFLRQAHDHEIVDLEKREEGTYQVSPFGARCPRDGR